jgi:CRP/FNR family cyclic AMP-dependent transcriptional regulator
MSNVNGLTPKTNRRDLAALVSAIGKNKGLDARRMLTEFTWDALSEVLARRDAAFQESLITQGDANRSVYFVESGLLRVYRTNDGVRLQLAVLGPGSVVGEGTFFAPIVRSASVETLEAAPVWELSAEGFDLLTRRSPVAALQVCRYLGAVLATRMLSVTGRLSIT